MGPSRLILDTLALISPFHLTRQPVLLLILGTASCLVPFVDKAVHIDDPVYIWVAKHILSHRADFYGFQVNWRGTEMNVSEFQKNPPGVSYYLALIGSWVGWEEWTLHLALLPPSIAAILGIYFLARYFCRWPLLASLTSLLTPVFLVSSTTIMSDVLMLAFWVWAMVLWLRATQTNQTHYYFFSVLLICLSALTKYFGMCLLPSLFTYTMFEKRRIGRWAWFLLFPLLVLAGYQWVTQSLYGKGLLLDAVAYVRTRQSLQAADLISKALTGLSFAGGCLSSMFFFIPWLWSRRVLGVLCILIVLSGLLLPLLGTIGRFKLESAQGGLRWGFIIHFTLFAFAGVNLIALAITDLIEFRDSQSLFLFVWIIGICFFATFLNWAITARTFLPMAPAASILLIRRLQYRQGDRRKPKVSCLIGPLMSSVVLALMVTSADYKWANVTKQAAQTVSQKFHKKTPRLWFQGHWGFQYYLQTLGAKPFDILTNQAKPGEIMVIPSNNANIFLPDKETVRILEILRFEGCRWLSSMHPAMGAGFYADSSGPLPYAFGRVPSDDYYVFLIVQPLRF
jgi:4-amino-4-deoxy-L-arabinose transferase-like glycosyltransferase